MASRRRPAIAKENAVLENLDPTLIAIAVLIWPITKSSIVMAAAAIRMWSRHEHRHKAADSILHALGKTDESQ